MKTPCPICGASAWRVFYQGPVRLGAFGKQSSSDREIFECGQCQARHLPSLVADVEDYYRTGNYREDLDQGNAIETYFKLTDDDQPDRLAWLGMHQLRGRVVADIGAGAGPFLDLVKGVAATTIAVEPNTHYRDSLRQRGHQVYPLTPDALAHWAGRVDAAVSFSVLEHVERPREFLAEIKSLLKPGGWLGLTTPNADDFMVEHCPPYAAFFYRKVHLWYFTERSLGELAKRAGFGECQLTHQHRFDLSNALVWLRDHRPSGSGAIPLDINLNQAWRQFLISQGRGDYLYAILR